MGRYRAPQKPGSQYITREGFERLSEELDFLWRKKRPEVTKALQEAAAEGDRSENAEYIYRKKQLREIDSRVRYLSKRLDGIRIVDQVPDDDERIYFGAWFSLEDEQGKEHRYRIVGPDEFGFRRGYISMDSPMGRAMMRKAEGDEVVVELPGGTASYVVLEVRYSPFAEDAIENSDEKSG